MFNKGTPKEKTFCLFCNRQIYGQEMVTEVTQRVPSTPHNNNSTVNASSPPNSPSLNATSSSASSSNSNPLKMSLTGMPHVQGVVHNTCLRKYNDEQKALSKGAGSLTATSSASASMLNAKGIVRTTTTSSPSPPNANTNASATATPNATNATAPQPAVSSTTTTTTAPPTPPNHVTGRETISTSTANAPVRTGSGSVTVPRIEITTSTSDMTGQLQAERGSMQGRATSGANSSQLTNSNPTRSVSPPSPKTRIYSASAGSHSPTPPAQSPALSPHSSSPSSASSPLRNGSVSALVETFQSKRTFSERSDQRDRRSSQDALATLARAASSNHHKSPRERGRSRGERSSEGHSSSEKEGGGTSRELDKSRSGESPATSSRSGSANPSANPSALQVSPNATSSPVPIPSATNGAPLVVHSLAHDLKKTPSTGPISKEKCYYHINIKETGEVTSYIPKTDRDTINDAIRLMCGRRQLNPDDYCCPDFDVETPLFKIVEKRIVIAMKKFSCHLCRKEVFQAEIKRDDGKIFHPICYNKFIKSKNVPPSGFNSKLTVTAGTGSLQSSTESGDANASGAGSLSDRTGGGSSERARDNNANAGAGGKRARRKSLALSPGVLPFLTSSNHRGQDQATPLDRFEHDEVASVLHGAKMISLKGCQGAPPNGFPRLILQEDHQSFIIETPTERTDLELRLDVTHLDYDRLVPYKHKIVFGSCTEKDSLIFLILIIPKDNLDGLLNLNQIIVLSSKKYVEWITIPPDVKVKTVRSQLNELLSLNAIDYFKVEPSPTLTKQLSGFCPKFDVHYPRMTIAILYCRGGESDPFEMFKLKPDSHSEGFNNFLKLMHVPPSFADTLDREYFDVSCFGIKVTYYCCTYLTEEQQRRLIGNTQTVIFFKDDDTPFDVSKTMSMGIVPSVFFVIQRVNELPTAKSQHSNNPVVVKATMKINNTKPSKNAAPPLLMTTSSNGNLIVEDEAHPQQLAEALNEAMSASAKAGGARARGKSGSLTSGRRTGHSRENSQEGAAAIVVASGSGSGFAAERERELGSSYQLKKTRSRTSSFDGSLTPPVLVTPIENVPNIAVNGRVGSENSNASVAQPADSGNAKLRNSKDNKKSKKPKNKDRNSAGLTKKAAQSESHSSETLDELDAEAPHNQAGSATPPPPSQSLPPSTPLPPTSLSGTGTPSHSASTASPPSSTASQPGAFQGTRYRVGCFRKTEITHSFLPALPHDSLIPGELSSELVSPLLHFVVAKAHNGLVEASRHPPINVMYEKPREHCLREIVKAHAPKSFWGS